ncbi:peptidoglycan bridge formation glycyltransferase FemA/FemB family protein [Candidatus Nomurabacteria bacterium]|uniref:Peptidoglycan bridge formation glycyltransferase FemA/FemB family protein n=1 Tax=Candidatus Dojkabacteria bacterium TaxID=2099670 RepID=A0A955KWM2_9BACT|nr:peptidoglycan bridge formation glycyltransferase FemA/FemB family protein [Candidatus Dojkabacteria bacterium]MCB9789936.1 peptidoglycan bridge formation glycyltransferase FemA/FemB family protein [Candidatus Nomurabacteria bacterium]MCB9803438.1 peptidoglycan bridge formation glycyltransferase FemA/FemB family protein [Candidatus Nomurabacteria bacterium]
MYELRTITDSKKWDKFARGFPKVTFIDSWLWGEFQNEIGNDFRYYGIYRDGVLVAGLPISMIKAVRGKYLHLRHSPLCDWEDDDLVNFLMRSLREIGKKEKSWFVRMSPLVENSSRELGRMKKLGLVRSTSHETDAEHTLSIDLFPSEDEILKQMRKNTRYYIKKAQKMGITVEKFTDMSKFEEFWKIFLDAVERNKWIAYKKEYVRREFEVFAKNDMATMYLSKYQDRYISAAIFTHYNEKSFYHHSGSLTEFRNIPSTYLLIWEAIRNSRALGFKELNLWGVVDPEDVDHPWYGLSLFKRGFGGIETKMIHAHDLILSPLAYATRAYEYLECKKNGY